MRHGSRRHGAGRDQRGMTLVELLLSLAIVGVIGVPLTLWATTAVRSQGTASDDLGRATASGLVNTWFSRDVASAQLVQVAGAGGDCVGGDGSGGSVKLTIISAGDAPTRVVYSEAPSGGDAVGLWRRECPLSGGDTNSIQLFSNVLVGNTTVSCPGAAPAAGGNPCLNEANKQVQLSLTPKGSTLPVTARATRRATQDSIGFGSGGNYPPIATITLANDSGYTDTTFTFDASASSDRDGDVADVLWTFPPGSSCAGQTQVANVSCTFGTKGSNSVILQVTDNAGGVSTTARTVEILNRSPRALAAGPAVASRGIAFQLDGTQSNDPDPGDTLTYQWDLGDDLGSDRYVDGAQPSVIIPTTATPGPRQISLTVTDSSGATDKSVLTVTVDTAQQDTIQLDPAPVNVPGKVPRVGTVGPGLPPLVVRFTPVAPFTAGGTGWRLYRNGAVWGATEVATRCPSADSCELSFLAGDAGDYEIARLANPDGQGVQESPRVPFRVNRAPTASLAVGAVAGDAPQRVVGFQSGASSDPDGTIISRLWSFGDGTSSSDVNPSHTFTSPGLYTVSVIVTDDDGAQGVASTTYVVEGAPAAPDGLAFNGWTLTWNPVLGAEQYLIDLAYDCGPSPQTIRRTIDAVGGSNLAVDPPSSRCGSSGTVVATVSARANGQAGAASAPLGKSG